MTKEKMIWWHTHWMSNASACRKAGNRKSSANYLSCAAARRRIYQYDKASEIEFREAA